MEQKTKENSTHKRLFFFSFYRDGYKGNIRPYIGIDQGLKPTKKRGDIEQDSGAKMK